jgi:hypothetical protein
MLSYTAVVNLLIGIMLMIPFLIIFSLYLWLSLQEILVGARNYNFTRAQFCNPDQCGFFYHVENDPQPKDCLSPFVSRRSFQDLSKFGNQPGCRRSIQVREIEIERKPASEYKKEFLETYNAFHISKVWWRVVSILAAIIFGLVTSSNMFLRLFSG